MDFFQGVVTDYLRADRAMFVNAECLIHLDPGNSLAKGRHWYGDAVAVSFRERTVYLCEITYSENLKPLLVRLQAWAKNWSLLCESLARNCCVPETWGVQPWVFIPQRQYDSFCKKFADEFALRESTAMPEPKVTYLESVMPWKYHNWNRQETTFAPNL